MTRKGHIQSAEPSAPLLLRRWKSITMALWLCIAGALIYTSLGSLQWFALGDTDDNMRMMQVRALLNGQDWFDLRQYRLAPPNGFNIHWSRLVDLPIAGLILLFTPLTGGAMAERIAIGVAPLLPLMVVMLAMGGIARKLIATPAFLVACAFVILGPYLLGMFKPTRIDHHGWQLAILACFAFGLVDPVLKRGGVIAGAAMGVSMTIGLELLPYLVLGTSAAVLVWIINPKQGPRLMGFGIALAGSVSVGYLLFASNDNRAFLCDAATPIWLSIALLASAVLAGLGWLSPAQAGARFGMAALGAVALLGFYGLAWPQCVGRLEQVSPELYTRWLSIVSEAQPVYMQRGDNIAKMVSLPLFGVAGYGLALWQARSDAAKLRQWLPLAVMAVGAALLFLFQTRVAAAAQLLAVPGVTYAAWRIITRLNKSPYVLVRVLGIAAVFILPNGNVFAQLAKQAEPVAKTARQQSIGRSGRMCNTLPALKPVALLPKTVILTFVDLGPRLITVTHHSAIAGPYHRNGNAILDVHRAFDGTAEDARAVARKYGATIIMICPNMAESTQYVKRSPKGFYTQLAAEKAPPWLERVDLGPDSPLLAWRIKP